MLYHVLRRCITLGYGYSGGGYSSFNFALIVVLFILLIIVGTAFVY
ncbi:YjcZ family sporulation protein [Sporolactobacillus sp. THM7-4]|nr:YjcZ family sporulation protein [Sporolactobacillus sp. THM7-4]